MSLNAIDAHPTATTKRLLEAFPFDGQLLDPSPSRHVPLGIEIEVTWRSYFPDLWVDGFPNVDDDILARITEECTKREETLIPQLMKTNQCGIKSGADKYWEFAFDPVTDVSITANQVAILMANGLIPPGRHALHITVGGVRATRDVYFMAMALEAMACSGPRIMTGFESAVLSKGWARKGFAGVFQKEGEHDLMHGYSVGSEIRILFTPPTPTELQRLLNVAQVLACTIQRIQSGQKDSEWVDFVAQCRHVLDKYDLPDENWKKPHINPWVWTQYAKHFPEIQQEVLVILDKYLINKI